MSDRKYRQRGYQDGDDRSGDRRRGPRVPASPAERPRGRGLGKPTATAFRCAVCGTLEGAGEIARDAECAHCGADLHSCTHCAHFDAAAPCECRREIPRRIVSKAKRNACELFEPKAAQEFAPDAGAGPTDAKAAFDALFKNL